jgi:Protein of unknown function (DUF2568)
VTQAALAGRFALELGALAAFGYWGAQAGWWLALLAPILAAVAWGTFAAPKSSRRLSGAPYVAFEVAFFALATAGLALTAPAWLAIVFGALAAGDTLIVHALHA